MNKTEKINKLTWEYFWNQKLDEIAWFFIISISLTSIITFLCIFGNWFNCNTDINFFKYVDATNTKLSCGDYVNGFFTSFMFLCILVLIFMLVFIWIKSNWKKAKNRASEELQ
jgi:hypothetical protein